MIGTVLRIERASIHDGPGLRTVVFLKGCPLKCKWCSTPESQSISIKMQKGLNDIKCAGCGKCIGMCPDQAIRFVDGRASVDNSKCSECLQCVSFCPNGAFVRYGARMTADAVVKEVLKDEVFFFHSGGGLTVSGGEALLQAKFTAEILKKTKEHAISTAIETSLFAPYENVEMVLPWLDYLYVDLKHANPCSHKVWTGVNNQLILENLSKIAVSGYKGSITVRIPLIPTVNDSDENLSQTVEICQEIKGISNLELLPYHRIGVGTYQNMGLDYELRDLATPGKDYVNERMAFYPQYKTRVTSQNR